MARAGRPWATPRRDEIAVQYEFQFSEDGKRVTVRTSGPVTVDDAQAYFKDLFFDPRWHDRIDTLADHRQLDPGGLSQEDLRALAGMIRAMAPQVGSGRLAMVVSTPLAFGLARMWVALTEPHADGESRVFYDFDEASDWLHHPDPEARRLGEGSHSD